MHKKLKLVRTGLMYVWEWLAATSLCPFFDLPHFAFAKSARVRVRVRVRVGVRLG